MVMAKKRLEIHVFGEMPMLPMNMRRKHHNAVEKLKKELGKTKVTVKETEEKMGYIGKKIREIENEKLHQVAGTEDETGYVKLLMQLKRKHSEFRHAHTESKRMNKELITMLSEANTSLNEMKRMNSRAIRLRKHHENEINQLKPNAVLVEADVDKLGTLKKTNPFYRYAKENDLPMRGLTHKKQRFEEVDEKRFSKKGIKRKDIGLFVEAALIHRQLAGLAYDEKLLDKIPKKDKVIAVMVEGPHRDMLEKQHFRTLMKTHDGKKERIFRDTQLLLEGGPYNVDFIFHEPPTDEALKEFVPKVRKIKIRKKKKKMKKGEAEPPTDIKIKTVIKRKKKKTKWQKVKSFFAGIFKRKKK